MSELVLTIGDKNLSSWSLRPWVLLKHTGIPFTEENIKLDAPETRGILREKSPSGFVPFLNHGEVSIWDSLAIAEYVNELFPEKQLWPEDQSARAVARAVSAEMHGGFGPLRNHMPMDLQNQWPGEGVGEGVAENIKRITDIWEDCRDQYGEGVNSC